MGSCHASSSISSFCLLSLVSPSVSLFPVVGSSHKSDSSPLPLLLVFSSNVTNSQCSCRVSPSIPYSIGSPSTAGPGLLGASAGPCLSICPDPRGVRGGHGLGRGKAVAAALRTSPPCLQSRGGKWRRTKEHLIPVSDSILSARVNEREASFCPYAAAFSPSAPERRSVFDAGAALGHFFLSFWMRR